MVLFSISISIIALSYLSAIVSAVPVALPRRGFSLRQLTKPDTQGRTINLPEIYASSFTKFGKAVPQGIKDAADNGSAIAKPEENDKEYLTPVKVGDTTLNLDIDTGSADLWVFSKELSVSERSGHSIYKPTSNSTKLEGHSWKISYGDGSGASGDVYKDTVSVGGVTAHGQAIEAAKEISRQFTMDKNNDGLLGLAFSSLNTGGCHLSPDLYYKVKPRPQSTFFDTVKSDLDSPLFAVSLKHHAAGSYDFGYIDKSKYTGSLKYTDVDSSEGFWMFTAEGYGVGDGKTNSEPIRGIVDTGTTLTLLPENIVSEYYRQVPQAQQSPTAGGYVFPCSAELPDFITIIGDGGSSSSSSSSSGGGDGGFGSGIGLGLGGGFSGLSRRRSNQDSNTYKAVTPGKHIKMSPVDDSSSMCFGGIQSTSGMEFSIFGDVFLKNQYVVFDAEGPRLGFAQQAEP